jgi:CBS domain-containing membrane protein
MPDRNFGFAVDLCSDGDDEFLVARVFLEFACSYLKDGSPTITADCRSIEHFEHEVARLKSECDSILEQARDRFAEATGSTAERLQPAPLPARTRPKVPSGLDIRLRVEDRMTRDVRTLRPNDKLSLADELMTVGKFRHVVVVDDDDAAKVVGVISQRDIFYGALAWSTGLGGAGHQKVLAAEPVKGVMQQDVVTVTPETSLTDAARVMLKRRIGCLPVVDNEGLVGILTEGDFLSLLTEGTAGTEDAGASE